MRRRKLIQIKKPEADLERYYFIHLQWGFIITLALLIALFRFDFGADTTLDFTEREREIIEIDDIVITHHETTVPPPQRPLSPVAVPNFEIVDEDFFDLDTEFEIGDFSLPVQAPSMPEAMPEAEPEPDVLEIFTIVEEMPQIVGGINKIYDNLIYPPIARMAGIEGRVVVQFVIDEEGRPTNPVVLRGIGGGCDEAAVNAIMQAQFTPGRQRGRAVKVQYVITIHFVLQSETVS